MFDPFNPRKPLLIQLRSVKSGARPIKNAASQQLLLVSVSLCWLVPNTASDRWSSGRSFALRHSSRLLAKKIRFVHATCFLFDEGDDIGLCGRCCS